MPLSFLSVCLPACLSVWLFVVVSTLNMAFLLSGGPFPVLMTMDVTKDPNGFSSASGKRPSEKVQMGMCQNHRHDPETKGNTALTVCRFSATTNQQNQRPSKQPARKGAPPSPLEIRRNAKIRNQEAKNRWFRKARLRDRHLLQDRRLLGR